MASPFPYPPVDGQVFDHPNGIEYVWSDADNRWSIVYGTATNTGSLPLLNPSTYQSLPSSVPDVPPGTIVQADYNKWLFDALQHVNKEANIEVQPAPGPTDPDEGRLWYDSNEGKLFLYYNDGSSTQWVEVGGGGDSGGEESEAFIRWHQFAVIARSSRFDYDPIFETNANSTDNDWEYQFDIQGDGNWVEVSSLDSAILDDIGWYGSMSVSHLRLNYTDEQANYPNAKVRFFVTTTMNGVTNTEYSCELPAFAAGSCDYGTALSALAARVSVGESIQEQVLSSIQQIQVQAGLHQLNLDNINEDQITQNESIASIEADQIVQSSQINALETQIQLLAQTQAVGKWTYRRNITNTLRPPATATFYGTDVDDPTGNVLTDWSKLQLIMVDKTDTDGTTYTFSDFQEGDKLEILATDGSSACYGTVTNNPNVDGYGNLVIAVERSNGGPVEEATYLLSVYRPGASGGEVDLDILDGRYLIKTGDQMTGELNIDKPSGTALTLSKDGQTNLKLWADGTAETTKTTFADANFVTKAYVDQNSQPPTPARFKWQYVGKAEDHAGDTLATGQFSGPQLGSGTTTYGLKYYLNLTALNASYRINSRPNDEEMSFPDANGGPLLSLWSDPVTDNSGTITLMCVQRIKRLKFVGTNYQTDGGFIEIETHQGAGYSHHFAGTGLSFNRHYYVQLSGVF